MASREIEIPLSRFVVLVAQLESIVASSHQQPPTLSSASISSPNSFPPLKNLRDPYCNGKGSVRMLFHSLLVLGVCWLARHLASMAMGKVIGKGDGISIYSRASSLQGWLADEKELNPNLVLLASIDYRPSTGVVILRILSYLLTTLGYSSGRGNILRTEKSIGRGLGLLTRLGDDAFTAKMVRSLIGELIAAVIGLHTPKASLFLAIEILLSEKNGLVDLRDEIGCLINAIVAVCGPKLALGSTFFF